MLSVVEKLKEQFSKGKYGYLAKNSFFFMIGSFGSMIVGFLLVPLYTSILSTSDIGLVDLIVSTSSLLVYAVTLCIGDAVFIFIIEKKYGEKPILKFGILLISKGLLFFSVIFFVFALWNPIQWPYYCYFFLWIHLSLSAYSTLFSSYLKSIDKVKEMALSGLINTAVTFICSLFFLLAFRLGLVGYLLSITIGLGCGLFYLILKCKGICSVIRGEICEKDLQRKMLLYSIPLIFNGISWWANSSLDRYFITAISGISINGIYAVSLRIPTILSIVNTIFTQAWTISAIKEYDKEDKDGFFGKAYTGYNVSLLLCCSVLVIFNVPLAKLLYAKDFFVAWKSSAWLIVSMLFNSMAGFVGSVFGAVKKSNAYAISTIIAAFVNIILNILLIPLYNEVGAAIATVSSFFILWVVRYIYSRQFIHWKIKIWRDIVAYALLVIQVILGMHESHLFQFQFICLFCMIILYREVALEAVKKATKAICVHR